MAKDQADPYVEDLMENSYLPKLCCANLLILVFSFFFPFCKFLLPFYNT